MEAGLARRTCKSRRQPESELNSQFGQRPVTVLSSEFSQANSVVMIGVGSQRAPWRCLVSNSGIVQEVMFAGSEGRL